MRKVLLLVCNSVLSLAWPPSPQPHRFSFHLASSIAEDTVDPEPQIFDFGWSDEDFEAWISSELVQQQPLLAQAYPVVFAKAPKCIVNWRKRFRGDPVLWKRIFKKDRVLKELVEAIPIIHALTTWILNDQTNVTILDLASGKGYLSMMLSELLPPDRVEKIILIDKQWPMCGSMPQPHHIHWDHIYGTPPHGNGTYFETWPIPLHTSKQNLKSGSNKRQIQLRIVDPAPGPVVVLAVHLCGTLAICAADLFLQHDKIQFLALKPCCLPDSKVAYEKEYLSIGESYSFPALEVCAAGKWSQKKWYGPPRWHLEDRFDKWCNHLLEGVKNNDPSCRAVQRNVMVQTNGGYQNAFLFAERRPWTASLWQELEFDGDNKSKED